MRFFAVLLALSFLPVPASYAQTMGRMAEAMPRQVVVNGTCRREVAPDRGSITLTAQFQDRSDVKTAVNQAVKSYEAARKKIQDLKLKDMELETVEYTVMPIQEWEKDKTVMKGYRARMGLQVKTSETQRIGEVIAVAADEGFKDVGALQMYVSRAREQEINRDCLKEATLDAKNNAELLASAVGAKVGEVMMLNQSGGHMPVPPPMPMMMKAERGMAAMDMAAPTVEAGKREYTVNVSAIFQLR
ncbi:MAG: SIMPL domain-containing protein [Dongiaceae bacterium]